jgi:hypothetical protein
MYTIAAMPLLYECWFIKCLSMCDKGSSISALTRSPDNSRFQKIDLASTDVVSAPASIVSV